MGFPYIPAGRHRGAGSYPERQGRRARGRPFDTPDDGAGRWVGVAENRTVAGCSANANRDEKSLARIGSECDDGTIDQPQRCFVGAQAQVDPGRGLAVRLRLLESPIHREAEFLDRRVAHLCLDLFEGVCAFIAQGERIAVHGNRAGEPATVDFRAAFIAQHEWQGTPPVVALGVQYVQVQGAGIRFDAKASAECHAGLQFAGLQLQQSVLVVATQLRHRAERHGCAGCQNQGGHQYRQLDKQRQTSGETLHWGITTAFKRSGAQDSTPLTSVSWVSSVKKVGKRGSTQCARPQPR